MLIECTECERQVSDKAFACPNCGNPMQSSSKPKKYNKSNKRRRLPNGFGQITEIKGRSLRNPFRAMVTVGKTDKGRPICKLLQPIAYFATYNEAYTALVDYHKNPYDLDSAITVKELYDRWSEGHFKTLNSDSSSRTIKAAWAYCSAVYDMKVSDIRVRHIKGCMDEGVYVVKGKERTPSSNIKTRIKSLFNNLLDYAVEYELIDRNYARNFKLPDEIVKENSKSDKEHIAFTSEEMELLWSNVDTIPNIDIVLIQCYSGWRPQELGLLELKDVDLDNWTFKGGIKTDAGEDRLVPIHPKIKALVERKYKEAVSLNSEYLINVTDYKYSKRCKSSGYFMTYDKYETRFHKIRDKLNLNPEHRPHDGRKHFVTMAKKYNLNEYAIKYMVGHKITDITEKVYTERSIDWLRAEIEKIK